MFSHRFLFLMRYSPTDFRFTQNFLAEKNSVKSVDSVGSIRTLTSVRIWILWEFFNYKLQKSECYRNLGTTLQRCGNDITGAR